MALSAAAAAAVALAVLLPACQNSSSGPEPWTMSEVHAEIGLVGGHQTLACDACHGPASLEAVGVACEGCHLDLFAATTDPDHQAAGYATACAECHTSRAWQPASIDHAAFGFPLEGAHARIRCSLCHQGGASGPLATDCWSCHEEDYRDAAEPDHAALEFATACQECHTNEAWTPALFDHQTTAFPLVGAHRGPPCLSCHTDGYAGTPTACIDCHRGDEPADHFGPDCTACHTASAWKPSTFDHEPRFPLARGNHRKYRNTCGSCHLNAGDYASYTCTDCHDNEHQRSKMDREHDDVRNYRYESAACYECHPRGSKDDADGDD